MKKIDINKIKKMTGDYDEWLMSYLKNKKTACAYLQAALDDYQSDHDKEAFMLALKDIARAQGGIAHLASETHLNREHLYRLLSGKGNPTLDTLTTILRSLGMRIKLAYC
jgi:probable addiction module antidote protein